jgi:hypothetical protein
MGLLDNETQRGYYNEPSGYGNYQFTSLDNIINGFMVAYVGEGKLISKVNRTDVQFHGMRALQEFSYDIFRSMKSQEIEVPNTLKMILPQDYVNYTKLTTSGSDGIQRVLYPTGKTSNPTSMQQNDDGDYKFTTELNRKITITAPEYSDLTDQDAFSLMAKRVKVDGSIDKQDIYFIFNLDNNISGNLVSIPSDTSNVVRAYITVDDNDTRSVIAGKMANAINTFHQAYSVSVSGHTLTIQYLDSHEWPSSENIANSTGSSTGGDLSYGGVTINNLNITVLETGLGVSLSSNALLNNESNTWSNYKSYTEYDYRDNSYQPDDLKQNTFGNRYGLDPQHAQDNGTFYIDNSKGFIHFGSALAGRNVILHYVSDGLGTDSEMIVHKFAEEAVYKWIAHAIVSSRSNMPEYIVQRFKKEKFAEARKAKIRLSNIKIEEFTQVLKGLSKPIK